MDDQQIPETKTIIVSQDGTTARVKRFRTDPRKQKEVIEQLFQKQKAIITRKSFMNMKGNRRFKSDVWNWFGDIRLLISRTEAKKLKIPYYIRRCGDEQMVLSKVFVGCFKCLALFIHDSQKSTSTLRYHIRTCSRPKERKKRTTPNIIFFPNKKNNKQLATFNESDVIPAHDKLLNCALSTESSLEIIQEPEFRNILQMCVSIGSIYGDVNVDSLLCATPTLTSFILNDLYVSSINEFYTEFQHSYGTTYKLNVWMDNQVKLPFVSVHCYYINPNGILKNVIIHTDDFNLEAKTPEDVRTWFSDFMNDQPVVPFKRLVAIDNESNLVSVFRDDLCTIKCCVQNITNSLQIVTDRGSVENRELRDFANLLTCCVELLEYFQEISDRFQLPEELIKCPDDKWTSIVSSLRSIEEQYEWILHVMNELNSTHLLSVEKSTIKAITEFFQLFEEAIEALSDCNKPTLNLVVPWISKLRKHCIPESEDPPALNHLKSVLDLTLKKNLDISIYHHIATLLDPRYKSKSYGFLDMHKEADLKLKCLVKECMESPNVEDMADTRKSYSDHFNVSGKSYDPNKCEKAALQEVDHYLSENFRIMNDECSKFDVLKFWYEHSETYPNLWRIAQWILSCPASCLEETESFWNNNWLVHCLRRPLPADNVNKVMFVKSFRGS